MITGYYKERAPGYLEPHKWKCTKPFCTNGAMLCELKTRQGVCAKHFNNDLFFDPYEWLVIEIKYKLGKYLHYVLAEYNNLYFPQIDKTLTKEDLRILTIFQLYTTEVVARIAKSSFTKKGGVWTVFDQYIISDEEMNTFLDETDKLP